MVSNKGSEVNKVEQAEKTQAEKEGFSTGLSLAQEERLHLLAEELCEAGAEIGKILRHGYNSSHPVTCKVNKDMLEKELGHVVNAIALLGLAGDINIINIEVKLRQGVGLESQFSGELI